MGSVTVTVAGETQTVAYGADPTPGFPPAGYKLAWSDEFTGTAVDPTKWNVRNNTYDSPEQAWWTSRPVNVSVANSILMLTARKETIAGVGQPASVPYTSGYLDTQGKAGWQYGYFEIRALLPIGAHTAGMWPGFWMRPATASLARRAVRKVRKALAKVKLATAAYDGELDWFEGYGPPAAVLHNFDVTDRVQWTIHQNEQATHQRVNRWTPQGHGLAAGYHTYGYLWTAQGFTFFLDGVQYDTQPYLDWMAASFAGPMSIRLNLQVALASAYWGGPDANTQQSTFAVDYIRVYQPS